MKVKIIPILAFALLLVSLPFINAKINNNIFDPKIFINKQMPISRLEAAGHRFAIPSTDENYQISGDVYESQTISEDKQIYNISNYKKSESCTYFKSILEMNSLQGQNLNFIALQSLVSEQTQQLFIIGMIDEFQNDKKFLKIHSFSDNNFVFKSQVSFDGTELSQDMNVQIFMTKIDNSTIFADGNFLYKLDFSTNSSKGQKGYMWTRAEGWNSGKQLWKGEQFLGLQTVIFQDKQMMMFLYTEKIVFYEYNETTNVASIYLEIVNSGKDAFQDAQIGYNNSQLYVLAGNQLLYYSLPDYRNPVRNELAGQRCTRIYIYTTTYHIICEYEKRNFVGEYFYNDITNTLILNRFYNDIENYRLLSYINNYFLMIGENDIILTSNGVNRKVLLDMPKNAYFQRFVSFGIESIHLIKKLQDSQNREVLFAIGQDFIVLFELKFVPAEIWCYIERPPESLQKSIMIVRNTSVCELNEKRQTLRSFCINLKPVQIFFQHYEIEAKVTSIVVIIVILLAFVLAFLCLGCVFRENMNYNHLVVEIKKKISKLQKKPDQELREL